MSKEYNTRYVNTNDCGEKKKQIVSIKKNATIYKIYKIALCNVAKYIH